MIKQKYMLNSTYGINGVNKISLKKIIEQFGFPNEIEIQLDKSKIDLSIDLKYDILEVYYTLYYFVENLKKPESHSLSFKLDKLYLNERENIKIGDELKRVLSKVKKYLKKNNKSMDFEYEEDEYEIRYLFDDENIDLFFVKCKNVKILDYMTIRIPYEDILDDKKILKEIKDVMELKNMIEKLFFK